MGDTVFSTIRDGFAQIEKMLEEKKKAGRSRRRGKEEAE